MEKQFISKWLSDKVVTMESSFYLGLYPESYGQLLYKKGSRGYDVDQLFKRLVDLCVEMNLFNDIGTTIINSRNKPALQRMIYKLSKKTSENM
jgi:hypothetical protein